MSGTSAEAPRPRRDLLAVFALAVLLGVTVTWWALALWPLPTEAPQWLVRTRAICFGSQPTGLPDGAGWIALLVQPAVMLGALFAGWGRSVNSGLRILARARIGRAVLGLAAVALLTGTAAAGQRVRDALGAAAPSVDAQPKTETGTSHTRLARAGPALRLTDQRGESLALEDLRGQVVFVTFAFAHCETVCPLVVRNVLRAQAELVGEVNTAVLIVTLDPWRDTPRRLPHIAATWSLGPDAYVLSGDVEKVNATLDAWGVSRSRDMSNGDIVHPSLVYLVDPGGRIAYAASGDLWTLIDLARQL